MRFTVNETLAAPREAVFDVLCDPRRRTEWQSSLASVHVEASSSPGLGLGWHEFTRGGLRFDLEITEFVRPERWAEVARGSLADARLAVTLEDVPAPLPCTRVIVFVEVRFKGPLFVAAPFVRALMPGALRSDVRRIQALAGGAAA